MKSAGGPTPRYLIKDGEATPELGPFSEGELFDLARAGSVQPTTFFREEQEEAWQQIGYTLLWERINPNRFHTPDKTIEFTVPPRRQRNQDYLKICAGGNGAILLLFGVFLPWNVITLAFGAALLVMFNVGLIWVLYFTLQDY